MPHKRVRKKRVGVPENSQCAGAVRRNRSDAGSRFRRRARQQVHDGHGLRYFQDIARERRNVFEALMEAVKTHSLGQISHALYDVGGEYRRNM